MKFSHKDIKMLTSLEHIRKRPQMYVGGGEFAILGLYTLTLRWALSEAISRASIEVAHDLITIYHDGEGLDVDRAKLEALFTQLGCGPNPRLIFPIINALSKHLTVDIHRDGKLTTASFIDGALTDWSEASSDVCGNQLSFSPDSAIFPTRLDRSADVVGLITQEIAKGYPAIEVEFNK